MPQSLATVFSQISRAFVSRRTLRLLLELISKPTTTAEVFDTFGSNDTASDLEAYLKALVISSQIHPSPCGELR